MTAPRVRGHQVVDVEICTEDSAGPAAARAGGAHGIELCAALAEGGLTPSLGMAGHAARTAPGLGLQVLIRPRGGDFVYSAEELAIMVADIHAFREHLAEPKNPEMRDTEVKGTEVKDTEVKDTGRGPGTARPGFTLGVLTPDGEVDTAAMAALVTACGPAPVTFHKAFDTVPDQRRALDQLVELGVGTVLTAGGPGPAVTNLKSLTDLVDRAGERLTVRVGGGVRADDVRQILRATGARAIHLRATRTRPSASSTGTSAYDLGSREVTSVEAVAEVVAAARKHPATPGDSREEPARTFT